MVARPTPIAPARTDDKIVSAYSMMHFPGGEVRVELVKRDDRVVERLTNRFRVAVTLEATRTTTNLRPIDAPREVVVPAGRTVEVATWAIADRTIAWREQSHYDSQFGDPSARPARYVYGLPFARGERRRVGQGFHGAFSHTGDSEYAVDFTMDEGSVVRAARDGVVVAFHDRVTTHGVTPDFRDRSRSNWIYVQHDDGTLGEYWHIAAGGVSVEPGQKVRRGEVLGRSGFTGYAQVPHLHFAVVTAVSGTHHRSFPFVLATRPGDRRGEAPVEGKTYAAFE